MSKETVQKVLQTKLAISEHSIRTNQPPKLSIFEAIKTIHATFENPTTRRAVVGEKIVECRGFKEKEDVLGVYLVGYIPNDEVGIVPHTSEDLELFPPPENTDFLDGEMMALISEEAVVVCRLGLFESVLNGYVSYLGPKVGLEAKHCRYIFKNRTDIDKLKMIQDDGVQSIRFDGVANSASAAQATESAKKPIVRSFLDNVWEEVQALSYSDKSKDTKPENLKVEVFLKFDKRSGTAIDQEEMCEIAEAIADSEEGFQIVTLSGRKITPEDVLLNKKISLKKHGKSVAFSDVFKEMWEYYKELTKPNGG